MISQKLEETLQQLNAAKDKDKPKPKPAPSSTDKHGELIRGFLK